MFTDDTLWVVRENAKLRKQNAREKRRQGVFKEIRKSKLYKREALETYEESSLRKYKKRFEVSDEAEY